MGAGMHTRKQAAMQLGHNSSHKMQRPNQEGEGDKGEGVREKGRG